MLRRFTAYCRPLWPVLLLVSFLRSRSPVVGVLGLCWLLWSFDCFCCPHTSGLRLSTTCLAVFPCASGPGALLLHVLSRLSTTYAPPLRGSHVRFMVDAGGVRACTASGCFLYAAL